MTNLTEQWKQGKLPSGEYYVKDELGLTDTYKYYKGLGFAGGVPQEVLAEVPTYDEYITAKKMIAQSMNENSELKETISNDIFLIKSRDSEIAKLKELLKDCREILFVEEMATRGSRYRDELRILIKRINQVLGEE